MALIHVLCDERHCNILYLIYDFRGNIHVLAVQSARAHHQTELLNMCNLYIM